jgi:hypothetical protein
VFQGAGVAQWFSDGLQAGLWGVRVLTGSANFSLGPTQPPIQSVPRAPSLGVKRQGREADNSPPSGAEAKAQGQLHLYLYLLPRAKDPAS